MCDLMPNMTPRWPILIIDEKYKATVSFSGPGLPLLVTIVYSYTRKTIWYNDCDHLVRITELLFWETIIAVYFIH